MVSSSAESSAEEELGTWQALSGELAAAVERVGKAVVAINASRRIPSSGVHWRAGVVVTSAHSIRREEEITVTLDDGRSVGATFGGRDPSTDLAVLKIEDAGLPVVETTDASELRVGQLVLAMGRAGERGASASLCVVNALGGAWRTWRGGEIDKLVRLDIALYPGFSGGPLITSAGQVAGINSSGLSRSLAVTIPAATVNRVVERLLERGSIARGYLGVALSPVRVPDALVSRLELGGHSGLIVLNVEPDGPADRAGLLLGDVVIAFNGVPVGEMEDIHSALGSDSVGRVVRAALIRGGQRAELEITVGERPRRHARHER
ncbi:MAG TPA: trypsin-like peptidase domain-containing protein [Pyrinomonadaceae bacterium]|jgi:S1-C subfamily serine protease